jgi:Ca2+-binding RTX toxin-like protein
MACLSHTFKGGPAHRLSMTAVVVAALMLGFGVAEAGAGGASCNGRQATIVSNAAKIVGTKAPDVIVAGPGDNAIYGEGGDDVICAGDGDDTIFGGRGNDAIFGEEGDDTIHGERGSDELDGGGGSDHVYGESGNENMTGGDGDHDYVDGGQGDDSVSGGAGDFDVVVGGTGNDKIDGGPGEHDIASYADAGGAVTVDLAAGTVSGAENEHLTGIEDAIGGPGDDTLIGDPATANRLDGGPGDDHLEAAGPGDEAFGGPGSDQCGGGFGSEESCGSASAGNGVAVELYESIEGASGLIVTGTKGPDSVTVGYSGGAYVIQGPDVELGDPTASDCSGGSGSVTCHGTVGSINASMGAGDDSVTIDPSVPAGVGSTLEGGTGSDTLKGGEGDDVLYAGEDHDPDTLEGGGGDDVIYGVNIFHPKKDSGAANMIGGSGDDLMIGGQPCDGDTFDGGPGGNDSASFARVHNSGVAVEATIGGTVTDPDVGGCNAGHIDSSTEKIEGSPSNDILTGDNGDNVILGRGGDDRIDGAGGSDTCIGGGGHDTATNCESEASVP